VTVHAQLSAAVSPADPKLFADFDSEELATTHRVLVQLVERAKSLREQ
jgi:hypothetical protein